MIFIFLVSVVRIELISDNKTCSVDIYIICVPRLNFLLCTEIKMFRTLNMPKQERVRKEQATVLEVL